MGGTVDRLLGEQQGPPPNFDQGGKVDSILGAKPTVDDILGGKSVPFDPNRLAPRQVDVSQLPQEPGLLSKLLDILKEQGEGLVQFGKYVITTPGFNAAAPTLGSSGALVDDIRSASQGDLEATKRIHRGMDGAAFFGSTIAASGAGALFRPAAGVAAPLLKRAAAFLGAEAIGGATYGAIAPLESGQSREDAIKEDMIQFPIAGAVLHGIFKGAGKLFKGFWKLDPGIASDLKGMGKRDAENVGKRVKVILDEVGDVPPQAEAQIHSEALAQAVKELKAGEQETTNNLFNDLRAGNVGKTRTVNLASVVEKVRGRPLTRVEFAEFLKDVAEDGEYMAVRKWQEAAKKPTTAAAKMGGEPPPEEGPDFTVQGNEPPKPLPVNPIGTDLQKAVAESEAARTAPPVEDIPQGITEPLGLSVVRDEKGRLKKVYHGTGMTFEQYDLSKGTAGALYGPGIYHTDDPGVAAGYSTKERNNVVYLEQHLESLTASVKNLEAEGPSSLIDNTRYYKVLAAQREGIKALEEELARSGYNPQTRPAYLDIRNPLDVDKPVGDEAIKALGLDKTRINLNNGYDAAQAATRQPNGEEVYQALVSKTALDVSLQEIAAQSSDRGMVLAKAVMAQLQSAGFDGITHIGGKITGGKEHRVYVAFSPDQVHTPWGVELQRVMQEAAQHPNSPVAQAAIADAMAEAVVEGTHPTEIMDEATKQKAVEAASTPTSNEVGDAITETVARAQKEGIVGDILTAVTKSAYERVAKLGGTHSKAIRELAKFAPPGTKEDYLDLAVIAEGFEKKGENPISSIGSLSDDPASGAEAKRAWSTFSEEQLDALRRMTERFLNSEAGALSARAATRIAAASLSGLAYYQAEQEDDPRARALLNTVGGILALGALVPGKVTQQWLRESKFTYSIIKAFDLPRIWTDGTKKGAQEWQAITQGGKAFAKQLENRLRPVFPDDLSKRAAMFSLDEGPAAPEWATLTPDQQREVASQAILNNQMGRILVQLGIIPHARAHYVRHLFQDNETQSLWYSAWEALGKSGQFARQRQFETLREAIQWATVNNKKPPVMDPAVVQPFHMIETSKAIAGVKLQDTYTRLGMLVDFDPNVVAAQPTTVSPRDKLRQVRVPNLGGPKMAPDDAATVLERAAAGAGQWGLGKEYIDALDAARGQLMRSIMFWAWEHGINVLRGAIALDGTGAAFRDALVRVRNADPMVLEVSKYADLFQRPDFGPEHQTAFDRMLAKIGAAAPTLKKLGVAFEDFRARGERRLWDQQVPALGMAGWTREMYQWTQRTQGRFLVGSPEYEAAAQQAGKFANDLMGKVPGLVQAPQVATLLRLILFSPQWTRGRISITAHAAGELQKIASGEVNPRDATYLGYKLRSLLVGATVVAIGSYLLTRKWPKFNPNTMKFYMNSGVRDRNGREVGVDMTGWWQDDLKLFNEPFNYIRDRQAPLLRQFETQVSGRDVFGRSLTGMERLENLVQSVGPAGELVSSGAGLLAGGHFGGAEALRAASGVAAVGNVSALPREADAIVGKMAAKLLRQAGLPDDKDRVFELSRLMRQNWSQSGTLYGGEVNTWIAYQRRAYQRRGIPWLWQEGKRVLKKLAS